MARPINCGSEFCYLSNERVVLLHLSNGEVFGMLSFKVLVVEFNLAHILLYISRRDDYLVASNTLLLVIDGYQ